MTFDRTAALLAAILLAAPAHAATLRSGVALDTDLVRLSDLFDDAGPGADRVLGPAPAPGTRLIVEAAQLAAIARQFGVDWRPASGADRVLLDRPGRLVPREDVVAALHVALQGAGAPEDSSLDLPGFAAPLVPALVRPQCAIEQLDFDAPSGRFTATLAITADGMATARMRLSGRLEEMVELPVPAHRLLPGSVIGAADVQMQRVHANLVREEVARLPTQAIGMVLRHGALPGQPLLLSDLARPAAVQRGALVAMELRVPGLALLAQGQAMDSGAVGDTIRVLNPSSHAVVEAEIVDADRVRVRPGSIPAVGPRGGSGTQVAVR